MLRELLAVMAGSPTASSLELRSALGLSREHYAQLLGHLVRLGYVAEADGDPGCQQGCHGCELACPAPLPRPHLVTPRGRAFLARG